MSLQMNIWSFLDEEYPDFREMNLEEVASFIGDRLSLRFVCDDYLDTYKCRVGEYIFSLNLSNYSYKEREGEPCILCNYMRTCKDFAGSGCAVDSIKDAISFFQSKLDKISYGIAA